MVAPVLAGIVGIPDQPVASDELHVGRLGCGIVALVAVPACRLRGGDDLPALFRKRRQDFDGVAVGVAKAAAEGSVLLVEIGQ
ncbi:MAG: hypothetical protein A07HN63_00498 [uncultured archaeon A07HN63]|nr:MAG: hypothetical protein A07HN63_00498 [uncultured archaeon A07HN63]